MADAAVKIRIMPDSPETNLDEIESEARKIIERHKGKIAKTEQEPIAFGLKAVILTFSIVESFNQDPLENELRSISHVSSAEIIDFRRISF
ncbi:elongation factor 1-beta [Candidatus Pacearchaeota archaeon]|nr:elongation factor 1-beta [Candidatus Pacearchaeota archaeon]